MKFPLHRKLQVIFLMICLFGAASIAAPTKIEDRHEYSTSLNSIAFIVMNWYGSLIVKDTVKDAGGLNTDALPINTTDITFDTSNIGGKWTQYRSQYPSNITQIFITHTELFKRDGEYQFNVNSKISYRNNTNTIQTQSLKETFMFSGALTRYTPSRAHTSLLTNISLIKSDVTTPLVSDGYDQDHYKVREFVYAWLGYIDGLSNLSSGMNGEGWLSRANYSLEVGGVISEGSVEQILSEKNQTLAVGGHLLKTLEVVKSADDDNIFVVDLILEWKGVNKKGKPVIAKINQVLKIRINEDKSWSVISINEKHLLPTISPWVGLLC